MRLLLISLLCISIISGAIIYLSFVAPFSVKKTQQEVETKEHTAQIYFEPQNIYSSCINASHSALIKLDTNSNSIQSVQIELSFNPSVFYNLSIQPFENNILGKDPKVDINEIRQEYGRASFVLSSSETMKNNGSRNLAVLSFNTYPQPASSSAVISFLTKSTVQSAASRSSILGNTIPLTVYCN